MSPPVEEGSFDDETGIGSPYGIGIALGAGAGSAAEAR
jgi:hypothetical protein